MSGATMASLTRWGFDPVRLPFTLRTALTACAAFALAWALGLEHPQWAGMTVWAASQPTRGPLIEKSAYRVLGTAVGVVFGVGLVTLSGGQIAPLVIGLTLWVGLCSAGGNLMRGLAAYGVLLSGYSASIVVLLDTAHADRVWAMGFDRFLTIVTGVLVALVVGLIAAPRGQESDLEGRLRLLAARLFRAMARGLASTGAKVGPGAGTGLGAEAGDLLGEMADLEQALEAHGVGSLRDRRLAHARHGELMALARLAPLAGLLGETERGNASLIAALERLASALEDGGARREVGAALDAVRRCLPEGSAREEVAHLARLFADAPHHGGGAFRGRDALHGALPRRDWVGARQAMARTVLAMGLVGGLWVGTGWHAAPFLLLGLSVTVSLFSTFENPVTIMRHVTLGQICGVGVALACSWLVWPLATQGWQLVALTCPFVLLGGLAMAHRRTMAPAMDFNMVLLLLLHPVFPLEQALGPALETALAVCLAPLAALLAFRLIHPVDAARRRRRALEAMVADLKALARAPNPVARRAVWRTRLAYRLLRVVAWSNRSVEQRDEAVALTLSLAALGERLLAARRAGMTAGDALTYLDGALVTTREEGGVEAEAPWGRGGRGAWRKVEAR